MKIIQHNPFRITGLLSNASQRDIEKQNGKLKAFDDQDYCGWGGAGEIAFIGELDGYLIVTSVSTDENEGVIEVYGKKELESCPNYFGY
jgi:hypothetical protein